MQGPKYPIIRAFVDYKVDFVVDRKAHRHLGVARGIGGVMEISHEHENGSGKSLALPCES